jgi:hypothetical protein
MRDGRYIPPYGHFNRRSYKDEDLLPLPGPSYEQYEVEPGRLFYSAHLSALETLRVDLRQSATELATQWTSVDC